MSEFTAGVLFLREHQLPDEHPPGKVVDLNSKWRALLLEDPWLQQKNTWTDLGELSKHVPLLYFVNGEDHGWGFVVLEGNEERANVNVSYEMSFLMGVEEIHKRHPDVDDPYRYMDRNPEEWQAIQDFVEQSKAYLSKVEAQYEHRNLEALRSFGITDEGIQELSEQLTKETYLNLEDVHEQVEAFKRIMGLEEMSWIPEY